MPTAKGVIARPAIQGVVARAARQRVIAGPAIQGVVARAAIEKVIVRPAIKRIVAASAKKRVRAGKTGQSIGQIGAAHLVRCRRTGEDRRQKRVELLHSAVGEAYFLHRMSGMTIEVFRQRHAVCGAVDAQHQIIANPRHAQVGLRYPGLPLQHVALRRGVING